MAVALISAAKLAQFAYKTTRAAKAAFGDWAKGITKKYPDMDKVYDVAVKAPDDVLPGGFKPPKGLEKGSGKLGSKDSPDAPKDPAQAKPADKPPQKESDQLPQKEKDKPPQEEKDRPKPTKKDDKPKSSKKDEQPTSTKKDDKPSVTPKASQKACKNHKRSPKGNDDSNKGMVILLPDFSFHMSHMKRDRL